MNPRNLTLILLAALAIGTAQAQPMQDGRGQRGPATPPTAAQLQADLGVDATKAAQLQAVMQRHADAHRAMREQHRTEMEALLTPEQRKRLHERYRRGHHMDRGAPAR